MPAFCIDCIGYSAGHIHNWPLWTKYAEDKNRKTLQGIGIKEYIAVGVVQGLAALPGVGRSGSTSSTRLLLNIEAQEAFRLSCLMGVFSTTAAIFVTLIFSRANVAVGVADVGTTGIVIAIIIMATAVNLVLINFLINIARSRR